MKYILAHSVLFGRMGLLSLLLLAGAALVIVVCILNAEKLKKEKKQLQKALEMKRLPPETEDPDPEKAGGPEP